MRFPIFAPTKGESMKRVEYEKEVDEDPEVVHRRDEKKKTNWKIEAIEESQVASAVSNKFGLCSKCAHVSYVRKKYGAEKACCGFWGEPEKRPLSSVDPVIECTMYSKAGAMEIQTMWRIAIFIDPKKPEEIGF